MLFEHVPMIFYFFIVISFCVFLIVYGNSFVLPIFCFDWFKDTLRGMSELDLLN